MRPMLPILCLALTLLSACASPEGNTPAEQKAYALSVRDEALMELYERAPEAREQIEAAPGYAFISGFSIHPGLLTFANGYGILQNNKTGKQTHIRLTRFAIGPGIAVKGYYLVSVIANEETLAALEQSQWMGGGIAEASFQFGDFGGSAGAMSNSHAVVENYLWTHTGVALELAVGGGKTYPEEDLNARE
jgi:hypothetical protein